MNNNIELTELSGLSPLTQKVLWAAMWAMVQDVHSPQDMLTDEEWNHADVVHRILDQINNKY